MQKNQFFFVDISRKFKRLKIKQKSVLKKAGEVI